MEFLTMPSTHFLNLWLYGIGKKKLKVVFSYREIGRRRNPFLSHCLFLKTNKTYKSFINSQSSGGSLFPISSYVNGLLPYLQCLITIK